MRPRQRLNALGLACWQNIVLTETLREWSVMDTSSRIHGNKRSCRCVLVLR